MCLCILQIKWDYKKTLYERTVFNVMLKEGCWMLNRAVVTCQQNGHEPLWRGIATGTVYVLQGKFPSGILFQGNDELKFIQLG
jgi:hypothetical protein